MFAQNEILVFTPGRRQECLERLAWIHSLMAPQPGFKEAFVAKYLGDGTRHTIMRFWDDEAAYQAFRATPDGSYGRNRPENLYVNEPVVTPLESYGEYNNGSLSGDFLVKIRADIDPPAWDAFLAHQQKMLANAPSVPGLVWDRQMRGKNQDSIIGVARMTGRQAFDDLLENPSYLELLRDMPEGVTLVRVECFEVVSDVRPKA
jgi:heme-degrading monooxygenase HmoA